MKITELFKNAEYLLMLKEGYLREQIHPTEPLKILNYTEKAQYDQRWNPVTTTCRGLIVNTDTDEVVSRPLMKFFNYDHKTVGDLDLNASVIVMDKADGSLGISYKVPSGGYAIATRGSFASDQAIHATELLNTKYTTWLKKSADKMDQYTVLFEIIYPENRIVLDYKGMDDLILLGMVDTLSGTAWSASVAQEYLEWDGPVVEEFNYSTFGEALQAKPRSNAEGFVVFFPEDNFHVKIKQEDYVALHKIVTGLNERAVWKHLSEGKDVDELILTIPDEFHEWVRKTSEHLNDKFDELLLAISKNYADVMLKTKESIYSDEASSKEFRKIFASFAKISPYTGFMFMILDNKEYQNKIWEMIKPGVENTPMGREITEDNT